MFMVKGGMPDRVTSFGEIDSRWHLMQPKRTEDLAAFSVREVK